MQLLPKFQVHEIFEMLSARGHISRQPGHSNDRFWGKVNVIRHVYRIPETKELMSKIRDCIRVEASRNEL